MKHESTRREVDEAKEGEVRSLIYLRDAIKVRGVESEFEIAVGSGCRDVSWQRRVKDDVSQSSSKTGKTASVKSVLPMQVPISNTLHRLMENLLPTKPWPFRNSLSTTSHKLPTRAEEAERGSPRAL